jgi:hypothetical protein
MLATASIMRFCMGATRSALYPAMGRSAPTSIAFRASKPKSLCNARARPRTATIEDVTSTAQIAI